jgi:hypothetical protein
MSWHATVAGVAAILEDVAVSTAARPLTRADLRGMADALKGVLAAVREEEKAAEGVETLRGLIDAADDAAASCRSAEKILDALTSKLRRKLDPRRQTA